MSQPRSEETHQHECGEEDRDDGYEGADAEVWWGWGGAVAVAVGAGGVEGGFGVVGGWLVVVVVEGWWVEMLVFWARHCDGEDWLGWSDGG